MKKKTANNTSNGRSMMGTIVSTKMKDTVVVEIERSFQHKLYKKIIRRHSRIKAHNDSLDLSEGDTVKIVETKPISKTKHFKVVEKLTK